MNFNGAELQGSIDLTLNDGDRFVVVADAQVPFEDKRLLDSIFHDFVPTFVKSRNSHLFLAGDIMDLYSLSRFPARVTPLFTLEQEVELTRNYLADWGRRFDKKHYIFGNHEDRWDREAYNDSGKLAPFVAPLPAVLELDKLGFDSVPYLRHYNVNGFVITHGDVVVENTASKMLSTYMSSGVSGHVNRPHSFTKADARDGEPNTWYVMGHTCRPDIGDFIKDWRRIMPWQSGFGIGEVHNGRVHFQLVRAHGRAYFAAGKVFSF